MLSDEEKQAIEYLKSRLYGNKGCKFIDVAQEDLRRIIKLIDIKEKVLKQAIEMLEKFITEHKLFNIRQADNLEENIEIILNYIYKLQNEVMEKELIIDGMKEDRRIAVEEIQEKYFISKDKIKEIVYPRPDNYIPLEVQCSEMYKKIVNLLEE